MGGSSSGPDRSRENDFHYGLYFESPNPRLLDAASQRVGVNFDFLQNRLCQWGRWQARKSMIRGICILRHSPNSTVSRRGLKTGGDFPSP